MKLLKIVKSQGFFLIDSGDYVSLDKMTKDHLMRLVDWALTESVEYDQYNEGAIQNAAHQIVYKNIAEKLQGLINRKQEFLDESQTLYLQEYERYREGESADEDSSA